MLRLHFCTVGVPLRLDSSSTGILCDVSISGSWRSSNWLPSQKREHTSTQLGPCSVSHSSLICLCLFFHNKWIIHSYIDELFNHFSLQLFILLNEPGNMLQTAGRSEGSRNTEHNNLFACSDIHVSVPLNVLLPLVQTRVGLYEYPCLLICSAFSQKLSCKIITWPLGMFSPPSVEFSLLFFVRRHSSSQWHSSQPNVSIDIFLQHATPAVSKVIVHLYNSSFGFFAKFLDSSIASEFYSRQDDLHSLDLRQLIYVQRRINLETSQVDHHMAKKLATIASTSFFTDDVGVFIGVNMSTNVSSMPLPTGGGTFEEATD
eukprot:Gb_15437 [translate_table: standard]